MNFTHVLPGGPAASGASFDDTNPARPDDDVLGTFALGDAETVAAAVDAAREGGQGWRDTSAIERAEILNRAAVLVRARHEELATEMAREIGKPIVEARGEVNRGATVLDYAASQARMPSGEVYQSEDPHTTIYTERRPLGVVGLITPWNFPFAIPLWKLAPALVAGNTIVLKPAEQSPLLALRAAEILNEAGLPEGVLNVVFGEAEAGDALVRHRDVAAISFTGSTAVGRSIAALVHERGAKAQTEMGGKNAVIVLDDADLDAAADVITAGAVGYGGQKCSATSRVIVEESVRRELVERVARRFDALNVGDPLEEQNTVGPLIDPDGVERTVRFAAEAEKAGARLVTGAQAVEGPGYFVRPGLLDGVSAASDFAQNEVFGPLVGIVSAGSADEIAALANASDYGLVASICSNRVDRVLELSRRLDVGIVKVNAPTPGVEPHIPFGGWGDSGNFEPEQGLVAREFYTEVQAIYLRGPA